MPPQPALPLNRRHLRCRHGACQPKFGTIPPVPDPMAAAAQRLSLVPGMMVVQQFRSQFQPEERHKNPEKRRLNSTKTPSLILLQCLWLPIGFLLPSFCHPVTYANKLPKIRPHSEPRPTPFRVDSPSVPCHSGRDFSRIRKFGQVGEAEAVRSEVRGTSLIRWMGIFDANFASEALWSGQMGP
jgi:hypothetical protein